LSCFQFMAWKVFSLMVSYFSTWDHSAQCRARCILHRKTLDTHAINWTIIKPWDYRFCDKTSRIISHLLRCGHYGHWKTSLSSTSHWLVSYHGCVF
jgi:hypothetical protein